MMCQQCQKRKATVAYTQIVDDAKKTLHLCNACLPHSAQPQTVSAPPAAKSTSMPPSAPKADESKVGDSKAGDLKDSPAEGLAIEPAEEGAAVQCATCGMSYEEFRKAARFGCHDCYAAFDGRLERLFKRVHGAALHAGKGRSRPPQGPSPGAVELEQLEQQLQLAVATEDYEEAAQLRDRIGRLKNG